MTLNPMKSVGFAAVSKDAIGIPFIAKINFYLIWSKSNY